MTTNDDAREALTLVDGEWWRKCGCMIRYSDGVDLGTMIYGKHFMSLHLCKQHRTEQDWQHRAEAAEKARDLALAHDTQPYPTAEAYEIVCEVLHKREAEVKALREAFTCIAADEQRDGMSRRIARAALAASPAPVAPAPKEGQ